MQWCTSAIAKFISGRDAKLTRFSMLDNFPAYIESFTSLHKSSTVLEELRHRENYHPNGRPQYSSSLMRYSLLLRYISLQCYQSYHSQLLQHFPLPSFSLLKKFNSKRVYAIIAAEILLHQDFVSSDVILRQMRCIFKKESSSTEGNWLEQTVMVNFLMESWFS